MSSIPLIDLTDALTLGASRSADVAAQLRGAATTSGFFYIANHGVPQALIDRQFALGQALLALPLATREALSIQNSPNNRGFEITGMQTLDADAHPDLKESFQCGKRWPEDHPYVKAGYFGYGGNQWPDALPQAPVQCDEYIDHVMGLAQRLMQLLALSLDLPETYFDHTVETPMMTLRMIRYPAHPKEADERTFGAGAHTDWGALTLLLQDEHGGLEVQMPEGNWEAAVPIPGTFVVNLGDMIPRWTNGLYHSNPHRVRNLAPAGATRYSIPFFFDPDYTAMISPVPGSVPHGESPRHATCTAGEHLVEKYTTTFGIKKAQGAAAG